MHTPLRRLNQLINQGVDYPDAIWIVSEDFRLSEDQVLDLEADYDDQFA